MKASFLGASICRLPNEIIGKLQVVNRPIYQQITRFFNFFYTKIDLAKRKSYFSRDVDVPCYEKFMKINPWFEPIINMDRGALNSGFIFFCLFAKSI